MTACEECGFDEETFDPLDAAGVLRGFAKRYRAPLTRFLPGEDGAEIVRRQPEPGVWSALEYAAHVRDVLAFWSWALHRVVTEDTPAFARVDPDQAAASGGYASLDPIAIADELAANAERFASKCKQVAPADWSRPATHERHGAVDGRWVVAHAVHEGNHHLLDIGRVLRAVRAVPAS